MLRYELVSSLATRVSQLKANPPIRVGISGITASGKTTLANELAKVLQNKNIIRTSIDHFHHPKVIRNRQGKESAVGYYEDAHDYDSFKDKLLIPLGPEGDLQDLKKDEYVQSELQIATKDMILIVDGTFLFKKNLIDLYDFKIFVKTDFEVAKKEERKEKNKLSEVMKKPKTCSPIGFMQMS